LFVGKDWASDTNRKGNLPRWVALMRVEKKIKAGAVKSGCLSDSYLGGFKNGGNRREKRGTGSRKREDFPKNRKKRKSGLLGKKSYGTLGSEENGHSEWNRFKIRGGEKGEKDKGNK